jgi:GNAT superfamily N-acetyltransferase
MQILPYAPERAPYFDRFNRQWIEQYFWIEPFDDAVLTQPETHILATGGELWFAQIDSETVGACALLPLADGMLEFTKLGVSEAARGRGVARALLRHCVQRAREKNAHTLRIFTSSILTPAMQLYVSEGFIEQEMTAEQKARYKRADRMLDLPLI